MKIEKNIPLPSKRNSYPFDELEVGDSFFVENKNALSISGAINLARKRNPEKEFTSKTMDDGVRVWRVK